MREVRSRATLFYLLIAAKDAGAQTGVHFVPNHINFWYNSLHWTTNFDPAFRDTVLRPSYMLPCTGQFVLCSTPVPTRSLAS